MSRWDKSTKTDKIDEMSKQRQLIERKKLEILAKCQERKKLQAGMKNFEELDTNNKNNAFKRKFPVAKEKPSYDINVSKGKISGIENSAEYDEGNDEKVAEASASSAALHGKRCNDDGEKEVKFQVAPYAEQKKKRKSRWGSEDEKVQLISPNTPAVKMPTTVAIATPTALGAYVPINPVPTGNPMGKLPGISGPMISAVSKMHPALRQYALKTFGTLNLSDEDWKKAEDHYKINLLYQDVLRKREEVKRLQATGKHKFEYDSDEDTEGGTWEHKARMQEMEATKLWADELTAKARGKHHIGDFLPPDELARFMEKYDAVKNGREPDLSDYKEFKLKEDNKGFQMLQKLGWTEGQGLGSDCNGITEPVNKAANVESHGLGVENPSQVAADDNEFDAYRKRMMLAYRFRPNPLNNPRRSYY